MEKIKVGVSACLLGSRVRYDGGHKHDPFITETLGKHFEFIPVCPESECGLPIPREAMRLEGDPVNPRIITNKTGIDKTMQMQEYCRRKNTDLEKHNLCGFILKKDSPSCGLFRVKVYGKGAPVKNGRGIFAVSLSSRFPLLPAEEEGRLNDLPIRENFIERIFAFNRLKKFYSGNPSAGQLVAFHTGHKLQLMAHSVTLYRETGALVAGSKRIPGDELLARYEGLFMRALSADATVKKNTNVLMHIMGYFKKNIDSGEKAELLDLIEQYRSHTIPLIVPVTMIKHYVMKYNKEYLIGQTYLSPHPAELMLRNHV